MPILEQTIVHSFLKRTDQNKDRVAFERKINGIWEEVSFREYREFSEEIAGALLELGLKQGDRVALLSNTRLEWALSDMGILLSGGVTVPIYPSSTAADIEFILQNSGAKVMMAEDSSQLQKILSVKSQTPELKQIILFVHSTQESTETFITFEAFCKKGRTYLSKHPQSFEKSAQKLTCDDIATIVYTSGTTGVPKGVILTHGNVMSELKDIADACPSLNRSDKVLTFLPYAHILARMEHFCGTVFGWTAAFAESVPQLVENLAEVRPTFMFCVPRIYEKVYNKIVGQILEAPPLKKKIFYWSLAIGKIVSQYKQEKKSLPLALTLQYFIANKLVFSKLKQKFGGRIRLFISGGAPLSQEIAEFFHAAGFLILEGYGLTETTAAIFANREQDYEFGTVGPPLKDVQVKIAQDGEILVKSQKVSRGYYNNPEATKEAFREGWFCTGDIGYLNERGHLKITDRKKDIIVTSAGKNIAPQKIENHLKTDPYLSQAMVYGDKRKYLSALITLNTEEIYRYAKSHDIKVNGNMVTHPEIKKLIQSIIDEKNKTLASFETIKRFAILTHDFTIEAGELTPSMKIKRKFCVSKYQDILEGLYS